MKFIRLEIKNLASLDRPEGEVIEFEKGPLAGSTIFSIVGPTGSGKSTILDAICLALFNRTPRYPRAKNDRNQSIEIYGAKDKNENARLAPTDSRNILTRGKREGYSRLTFLANDGTLWRAEWTVRKNRIRFEQAQRSLYRITVKPDGTTVEEPADSNSIPTIIGLDYDQFLRTVVLAQGSFANFLTAKEDERYMLLEKLVGCDTMYSRISDEITQRKKTALTNLDSINARLSIHASNDLTDEELEQLQQSVNRLKEEADKNSQAIETTKKQLEWYDTDRHLDRDTLRLQQELDAALRRMEALKPTEERLQLHDLTIEAVKTYEVALHHRKSLANAQSLAERLAHDIEAEEKEREKAKEHLESSTRKMESAEQDLSDRTPRINRARVITGELSISRSNLKERLKYAADALQQVTAAKEAIDDNNARLKSLTMSMEQAESARRKLREMIEANNGRLIKELSEIDSRLSAATAKLKTADIACLQKTAADAQGDINLLKEGIANRLRKEQTDATLLDDRKRHKELTGRMTEINSELNRLTPQIEQAEKSTATLRDDITLLRSADLQHQRSRLEDGKACPLCGSTHHPYAEHNALSPVIDHLSAELDARQMSLERLRERFGILGNESGRIEGETLQLEKRIAENLRISEQIQGQWDVIVSQKPAWPDTSASLTAMLSSHEKALAEANRQLSDYNLLRQLADRLHAEKDRTTAAIMAHRAKAESDTAKSDEECYRLNTEIQTATERSASLQTSLAEKNMQYDAARKEVEKVKSEITATEARIREEIGDSDPEVLYRNLVKAVEEAKNEVSARTATLNEKLTKIELAKGGLTQTRNQISAESESIATAEQKLDTIIAGLNDNDSITGKIDRKTIDEISRWDDDWEKCRRETGLCRQTVTAAQATLAEKRNDKNRHLLLKPETDENSLHEQLERLSAYSTDDLDRTRLRIQSCMEARRQMGDMADELRRARENASDWTQISEAIGGDGKTLRKIAQTYTLRFLIAHANEEIRRFNRRYELMQVKDSLGIRVIDHDRADDIRDTTSLSGGETFIVSLGLALGLSALSSHGVSLANLFIDEGFGTLDPDSLATVIDALARLQSSRGKKVGVISHTDTMSERITTQIRIVRNGNSGSSHLEFHP